MKSERIFLYIGLWLLLVEFLGVRSSLKSFFLVSTGALLIFYFIVNYFKKYTVMNKNPKTTETFSQNGPIN